MGEPTDTLETRDGLRLFLQAWAPAGEATAVLAVVHGYGEHGGRYGHFGEALASHAIAVHTFDLRGHGRSGGRRGHVRRFADYLDDTRRFVDLLRHEERRVPLFLLGHSLGGLIAAAEAERDPAGLAGLVLSSPFLRLKLPVPPRKERLARLLSRVAPAAGIGNPLRAADLSHDESIVAAYDADPLNHRVATARWAAEMLAAQAATCSAAPSLRLPLLVMYAGADAIADPQAAAEFHAAAGSADKTRLCYEGFYHEIFNETGRDRVVADLNAWLAAHALAGR